ncbi:MAG TPA: DMT family protein [Gemmatimonadales bacterium]|nr:DMT family protein [Gemmatimonadales bacterium]
MPCWTPASTTTPAGLRSPATFIRADTYMTVFMKTALLLVISNIFMTFAWYAHLRNLTDRTWVVAALASWGLALFEYLFQVPANRIGHTVMSIPQLKILQEIITLSVFVPFSLLYLREPMKLDYLWAALCLCGAAYFMFRGWTVVTR